MPLCTDASFGWFQRLEVPFGPTWWSTRHRCFARVYRGGSGTVASPLACGLDVGTDAPGPRRLAWSTAGQEWVAIEHTVGATLAELLAAVPARDLHEGLRRHLLARLVASSGRMACDGWLPPTPAQVQLGFDGTVEIHVQVGRPPLQIGHAESALRDEFREANAARRDALRDGFSAIAQSLHIPLDWEQPLSTAVTDDPATPPLGPLLRDVFPERARAWTAARAAAELLAPLPPPPGEWTDPLRAADLARAEHERRWQEYRAVHVYRHLNVLLDADRDVVPSDHGFVPGPETPAAVAQLHRLRSLPFSTWTRAELLAWPGLRHQRRRWVRGRRGMAETQRGLDGVDAWLEETFVAARAVTCRRPAWTPPPSLRHVAWVMTRKEAWRRHGLAAAWEVAFPGEPLDETLRRERELLIALGCCAVDAWCAYALDATAVPVVIDRWARQWQVLDAGVTDDERAATAALPPRFAAPAAAALARAADDAGRATAIAPALVTLLPDDILPTFDVEVIDAMGRTARARHGNQSVEIGGVPGNSVVVSSPTVGVRHARVVVSSGRLVVAPRGTRTFLMVDGQVTSVPMELMADSELFVGGAVVRVRLVPPRGVEAA